MFLVNEIRRHDILDRYADRFVERDFVIGLATGL